MVALSSNLDCGDVFQQFTREGKFADVSKNIFESKGKYYKLARHTTDYIFAIAEISSVIPTVLAPIFQAVRSVSTIAFEGYHISRHIQKIHDSRQELIQCKYKIEKWTQVSGQNGRRQGKLESWQRKEANLHMQAKKSYIGIAVCAGAIALEIISMVGIALLPFDGGLTFVAIKIGSDLLVSALKYGKYMWWNVNKGEKRGIIAVKSIEHIATAILKIKVLPLPAIAHPSLIKGACKAMQASIEMFHRHSTYQDNCQAIVLCEKNLKKQRVKSETMSRQFDKIINGDRAEMTHLLEKYTAKRELEIQYIQQVEEAIRNLTEKKDAQSLADLKSVQTLSEIARSNLEKWSEIIHVFDHALQTNDLTEAKKAAEGMKKKIQLRASNWSLGVQFHKKNNHKEAMRIILDIVEIARFAFLVTSVTLALAGFGVNLLPFLFASGLFANVLYLAHTWYCKQIDDKLEKIFGWWNRDEVAPATVLESSARVG